MPLDAAQVEGDTRRWLERAVIGLNLCPFAKSVYVKGQVRIVVSEAVDAAGALDDLARELDALAAAAPQEVDTVLIVLPEALHDFLDFHDCVARGERLIRKRGLEGVLQLASFHPRWEFAGEDPQDVSHFTNRSPHPTLHLLREDSIARAVEAFPDAEAIYGRNIETLRRLGRDGWNGLGVGPSK
jgi:hypothetical protein